MACVVRSEFICVLAAMNEDAPLTFDELVQKVGCVHLVLVALPCLSFDGLIDVGAYTRTSAGTAVLMSSLKDRKAIETLVMDEVIEEATEASESTVEVIECSEFLVDADNTEIRVTGAV